MVNHNLDVMNSQLFQGQLKNKRSHISTENTDQLDESVQVVEFLLGTELFALDLFDVKEVVEYTKITKLPNTSAFIKGIIDLRGEITTIIDIKRILGVTTQSQKNEDEARFIVLDNKLTKSKIGVMVDDVLMVSTFSRKQVDRSMQSGAETDQIIGIIKKKVTQQGDERTDLILWINITGLLASL